MKHALSLLTAFVVLQTQSWALSGGPVYPTGAPNVAGIYSGVLVQQSSRFGEDGMFPSSGTEENQNPVAGNIGVYTVNVPVDGGLSTGDVFLFINGTLFDGSGGLTGLANPDEGTFDAVLTAAPVLTFTDQNGNTVDVSAEGQMQCKITERSTTPLPGETTTANGNAARMRGSAIIDAATNTNFNLAPIPLVQAKYSVSGFRQITTPLP